MLAGVKKKKREYGYSGPSALVRCETALLPICGICNLWEVLLWSQVALYVPKRLAFE